MTDWTQQPPPRTLGGRMRAAGRGAESMLAAAIDDARELVCRELRLATARATADHWRRWALVHDQPYAAHALCMVLAALDGETQPEQLGIGPEPPDDDR